MGRASPARAGMDRRKDIREAAKYRFPRTRGDGPVYTTVGGLPSLFPPHARGWTASRFTPLIVAAVSPARAGMDLHPKFQTKKV